MNDSFHGNLIVLLMTLGFLKCALAGAYVEIKFLRYSASCTEFWSDCDPVFYFCLDRPRTSNYFDLRPCYYNYGGNSNLYYSDTNYIDFSTSTSIMGIANPWITYTNQLKDKSMWFVIEVEDYDVFVSDYVTTMGITLAETVYPSEKSAAWATREMERGSYTYTILCGTGKDFQSSIRVFYTMRMPASSHPHLVVCYDTHEFSGPTHPNYCNHDNYYSEDCSVYCLATNNSSGHYTCQSGTGRKVCLKGWTGYDCNQDLNECSLNYCSRGICENVIGDYICHCPIDYRGKNCTIKMYPCDSKPCMNNATCINGRFLDYTCKCVGGWKGDHCDIKMMTRSNVLVTAKTPSLGSCQTTIPDPVEKCNY